MNPSRPAEKGYESRIQTRVVRLFYWSGAWAAATLLMALGPRFLWAKAFVFTLLSIGLNIAVGVGMILSNKNYLAELDELQRKVQLNSMGITLGVGLIIGVPLAVLDGYHMIPFHGEVSCLVILMGLTFAVSNLYGTRRYR